MNNMLKTTVAAVILALGLILSSFVLSKFFVSVKHEKAITVKGYAESDIVSDIGKFYCTASARDPDQKAAYEKSRANLAAVLDFLKRSGFSESEITADAVQMCRVNKRNEKGIQTNETEFYDAYQTVSIASSNVSLVRDVSRRMTELIKEGIDISVGSPEFLVSDLKDAKLSLLAAATEDGFRRAQSLAQHSGARVGALVSAQQGVLQITQRHSTETSGYGMYDTSTIEKTVKAVVTLEYQIEPEK